MNVFKFRPIKIHLDWQNLANIAFGTQKLTAYFYWADEDDHKDNWWFLELHTKDLNPTVQVISVTFNPDYILYLSKIGDSASTSFNRYQYLEIHFLIWEK